MRLVYLYIKTHNITQLKYFGKTINEDIHKYRGSGTYWRKHIKKHGNDVTTELYGTFYEDDILLQEVALDFSIRNDIVKSRNWANLIIENGLDGAIIPWNKGLKNSQVAWNKGLLTGANSLESNIKRSETLKKKYELEEHHSKGKPSWNKGLVGVNIAWNKGLKADTKQCPHCLKYINAGNFKRWHGDNCKYK